MTELNLFVEIAPEVRRALSKGEPVVALESSIIAQGLPYPDNIETALAVERRIAERDVVPATIAILDGKIRVGLRRDELEFLATAANLRKLSRNDLAAALAAGDSGATTVAATMICARAAGIKVFATGGIGGVHRLAEQTLDISRDLHELAETPVIVVASGAKSILDLPKTIEVLETLGVPVISHGQEEFAAFWSRESGVLSPLRIDDPGLIAAAQAARENLGIPGGMLVSNPIRRSAEVPLKIVQPWVDNAVAQAAQQGITGKKLTPFLLNSIAELSGGATLRANKILVQDNAELAARIAVEYTKLRS
ncbi:MAG: pseudouridine-5'-phosphate glycosidase [Rhodobacteraceae bacterium]|nr:pseudouridine-5'-phosphate glycosidase [Paracoccaceae bacterium]